LSLQSLSTVAEQLIRDGRVTDFDGMTLGVVVSEVVEPPVVAGVVVAMCGMRGSPQ
jgi:hypothetical protein